MITSINLLDLEESNRSDTSTPKDKVKILSTDGRSVTIVVESYAFTVNVFDLRTAIENAVNINRGYKS